MCLRSSPGSDITMTWGSNQATYLILLLTSFFSSDVPLSYEPFCVSLPYHTTHLLTIIMTVCLVPQGAGLTHVFSSEPGVDHTQACLCVSLSCSVYYSAGQDHTSSSQADHNSDQLQVPWIWVGSWLVQRCCWSPLII